MRTAKEICQDKNARTGGVYELAIEVGDNRSKAPVVALVNALFSLPFVQGPFDKKMEVAELDVDYFDHAGYLEIEGKELPFVLFFISEEGAEGSNWLDISFYTGTYEEVLGAEYQTWSVDAKWHQGVDDLLLQILRHLNSVYTIRLGLMGYEISGIYSLQWLQENELGVDRYHHDTFFVNKGEVLQGKNHEQVTYI